MQKLHLHIDETVQKGFSLQELNLLLVFQVNCPGCFLYAIPTFAKLFDEFKNQMGFLALSTAFEDFDKNTLENTQLLINKGELVGETLKAYQSQGKKTYDLPIQFPVAMDKHAQLNEADKWSAFLIDEIKNKPNWDKAKFPNFEVQIKQYLKSMKKIPLTFSLNFLRGTPSFILFDKNYHIIEHQFGHVNHHNLQKMIQNKMVQNEITKSNNI